MHDLEVEASSIFGIEFQSVALSMSVVEYENLDCNFVSNPVKPRFSTCDICVNVACLLNFYLTHRL